MSDEQVWPERLSRLNELLATLYPDENDARRVVIVARIPSKGIRFDTAARLNWFNILQEADRHNGVANIVAVARREFPDNPGWAGVEADSWGAVKRFAPKALGPALAAAAVVGLAGVLAYIYFSGGGLTDPPVTIISGYILYQNSDAVVKGAVVRLPANNRESKPTDDAGFFELRDVPPETRLLYVHVAGKLHDLTLADQPGYRYRVEPAVSDTPPTLDTAERASLTKLILNQPGPTRGERPARRHSTLWGIGATLRVAFLDGTPEFRKLVRTVAPRWSDYANIQFDFEGDPKTADVRVSFAEKMSYSYVGTDALGISKQHPTLVPGTIDDRSTDREGTILHEFGHLLGLVHEYQTPNAQQSLDWSSIYTKAARPPLNWSRAAVDASLRPPRNLPEQYSAKLFDPNSVMMATLPGDWFSFPMPVTSERDLSQGDKDFIALLYPRN